MNVTLRKQNKKEILEFLTKKLVDVTRDIRTRSGSPARKNVVHRCRKSPRGELCKDDSTSVFEKNSGYTNP